LHTVRRRQTFDFTEWAGFLQTVYDNVGQFNHP
jgi:hypothetical protein